jgi:RNA polymerase sigma-70 factor (ECF subfamily)
VTDIAVEQRPVGEALVRRAASGDEIAFAMLIAEHNAAMARVAFVIVGDREQTLDAVQSAWTIAWRKLGSLRDPAQVRSWLIAIAANEARQQIRHSRRASVVDISHALSAPSVVEPDMARVIDLEVVLRDLNGDDRRLLALRYVAELDSTEIARLLGMSASGVRSRLARLLERLRTQLEPDQGAEL